MISPVKKILFIINPISGIGKQKVIEKLIDTEFDRSLFDIIINYTERSKHAIEISKNNAKNYDIIVAVGGDGSVNEIARGLLNSNTLLAIVPAGSGNGLARHLKIPLNLTKALKLIINGRKKKIDAIKVNDEYSFCTTGVGFDAFVSWKFSESKKRGFWTYTKISLKSLLNYQPAEYKVIADGKEEVFSDTIIATFANANQYGNNFIISPNSKINDGYIRLIVIKKFPFIYYPVFAYYLLTKKLNNFSYCTEIKAKEFTIFNLSNKIHIDGEPIEMNHKISLTVLPKSLNVIVP